MAVQWRRSVWGKRGRSAALLVALTTVGLAGCAGQPGAAAVVDGSAVPTSDVEAALTELMPWFQGDGAYYLYLSGQDQTQAFGVDYLTTVSPYGTFYRRDWRRVVRRFHRLVWATGHPVVNWNG